MTTSRPEVPLLVLVGPTASGKSALAAALGARLPGEVINADSVQVYRHFDIGSGKPTAAERGACPHHLFDMADPFDSLDAAIWAQRASQAIAEIRGRGRVPIVCGGTFLWIRALLFGLASAPKGDEARRREHREFVDQNGVAALHARLAAVDAASADRLHENDVMRVSRALEVFELTGRPLSTFQKEHGFRRPRFEYELMAIAWPRPAYEERLALRVERMLDEGFVAEVERLLASGYATARAMTTVGYKQVAAALALESWDRKQLSADIVRATRIFARRQRTWLREEAVTAVDPKVLEDEVALDRLVSELRTRAMRASSGQ